MDEGGGVLVVGLIVGAIFSGLVVNSCVKYDTYYLTCPTILEQSTTAADSLAVFQKHEGCWEYVQRGQP